MRSDKPKLHARHKEGAKREQKDLENRRQPQRASAPRDAAGERGPVRRRDPRTGETLH